MAQHCQCTRVHDGSCTLPQSMCFRVLFSQKIVSLEPQICHVYLYVLAYNLLSYFSIILPTIIEEERKAKKICGLDLLVVKFVLSCKIFYTFLSICRCVYYVTICKIIGGVSFWLSADEC